MFLHNVLKRKRRFFQGNFSPAGFTFLEIIISLTLISVGMLLYLEIFNTALDAHSRSIREIISTNLAQGLMSEIMAKNFEEPGAPPLGPDGTESGRGDWDDVDDYLDNTGLGYTESPGPPDMVGGLPMDGLGDPPRPNYAGFFRTVITPPLLPGGPLRPGVIYVDCAATCEPTTCPPNCDYKQVTVEVTDPRGKITRLVGVRTRGTGE